MNLKGISRDFLLEYVVCQANHHFPDKYSDTHKIIDDDLDETLSRLNVCINAVRMWKKDEFYYLHSEQYAIFLYYLANTIWKNKQEEKVCSKLFFLNKALNGFVCCYDVELPDIFFIGHSVGIVLARAVYSNYLVLYQNSTVGKNHGHAPELGERVVLYPNTAIIGGCQVKDKTVISQGVSLINRDTPGNCLVFQSGAGVCFKEMRHDIPADIFR